MQFKVPQNIDLEDKIVGPLTLIQFVYLMAGGIIIYISFNVFSAGIFWLIAIPTALLSLSLAFLKIQDQPFSHFLLAAVLFFVRPAKRIWHKELALERLTVEKAPVKKKEEIKLPKKGIEKSELEKLAYILDTHGKIENK